MKFSELKNKDNKLSFSLICLIISVASLIKGQDILSTLLSFTIVILVIINMYLIQQKELLDFNIKNVFKYLTFRTGLSFFTSLVIVLIIGGPFIKFFSKQKILNDNQISLAVALKLLNTLNYFLITVQKLF